MQHGHPPRQHPDRGGSGGRTHHARPVRGLRSAFYSVVRTAALPLQGEEALDDLRWIQERADIPAALAPLAFFVLAQPGALADLVSMPHLVDMPVEAHRCTYFTTSHASAFARSRRGSRPGNALADAVFSLSFAVPLATVSGYIKEKGLCLDMAADACPLSANDGDPDPLTDVAYADDALSSLRSSGPTTACCNRRVGYATACTLP